FAQTSGHIALFDLGFQAAVFRVRLVDRLSTRVAYAGQFDRLDKIERSFAFSGAFNGVLPAISHRRVEKGTQYKDKDSKPPFADDSAHRAPFRVREIKMRRFSA